jgi:cellulose synthase/poly-beta-1,6-N-acetylglucosamine synthase-like glycosyltransferase
MAKAIFWAALAGIAYVYAGYPLLLLVWRTCGRRPVRKRPQEPSVSLVIVMCNERTNVQAKMQNCLDLDYPAAKLQVIVSLDAPTDGTEALVRGYAGKGLEVVSSPVHRGKAEALNSGVAAATGEIVVFADARQRFEKGAVRELTANFADATVGAVSGELVLLDGRGKESSDTAGMYWRYEKKLRAMESDIHSVPGATGAIYAIRRELFAPLEAGTILDDVAIPMRIVLAGTRVIFDPAAKAHEVASGSAKSEYRRKTRTLAGNYQLFAQMPELLAPWRNPIFVQVVSHKLGRLLVPYCLVALFISNLFLLRGYYLAALAGQVLWYGLAAAGWLAAYTFVLMNWAAVAGLYHFVRGSQDMWNPAGTRRP